MKRFAFVFVHPAPFGVHDPQVELRVRVAFLGRQREQLHRLQMI